MMVACTDVVYKNSFDNCISNEGILILESWQHTTCHKYKPTVIWFIKEAILAYI